MAKPISDKLQKHLKESLSSYFEEDAFFILGVSGGPDSMALLYLFYLLNLKALVVHVNYAKRGKQSDKDQELAEQMAFQWGFECCSVRLNPKDAKGKNFQNWAREQRYQFFRDLKADYKADGIVTAHHKNDQVETILQKIFRGSSPAAWQGMQAWNGELFRPMLPFSKKEILLFCEAESIPYRIDKSNESSGFARNFIRNEFSEKLDEFFPGWEKNILALPEHGKAYESSMQVIANQVSEKNTINLKKFSALPEVLKPAIMKTILDQSGVEPEYSKGQLKELAEIEFLQTGKNLQIGNLLLTRDRQSIHIHTSTKSNPISQQISRNQAEEGWKYHEIEFGINNNPVESSNLNLDASCLKWPLTLRGWESGDDFTPLGMSGTQKISDHLTNRKIPTLSREKVLVLCGADSTIYAIIYPVTATNGERGSIADSAKYTSSTKSFLTINIL